MGYGPSAAWFYEGQLRFHRNWNWNSKTVIENGHLLFKCSNEINSRCGAAPPTIHVKTDGA